MYIKTEIKNGEIMIKIESRFEDWKTTKHLIDMCVKPLLSPKQDDSQKLRKLLTSK